MDAAARPRGLVPCGDPGATGAPLVDWVLRHPDVCGVVLGHLAPRDVLGLRASCKAARAAVAGHPWDAPGLVGSASADGRLGDDSWDEERLVRVPSRAALARFRACYPAARAVVIDAPHGADCDLTGADVAALAGVRRLVLQSCPALTDAAFAPLAPHLVALALARTPGLTSGVLAGLPRLERLEVGWDACHVTDADLRSLPRCTHLNLFGDACAAAGAGLASMPRLVHLALDVPADVEFSGSGLAACTALVSVRLGGDGRGPGSTLPCGVLTASAGSLHRLHLSFLNVASGERALAASPLVALALATFIDVPGFGDDTLAACGPALTRLRVSFCDDFVGRRLVSLSGLASLLVACCPAFTGEGLAAVAGSLTELTLRHTPGLTVAGAAALGSLRRLRTAVILDVPHLTDAVVAGLVSLESLDVDGCAGFVGALLPGLARLRTLRVHACPAFGWAAGAAARRWRH